MTPGSPLKRQQNIPKWLGPVIVLGAAVMAVYGKPSPGVPQWVFFAAVLWFNYLRKPPKD